MVKTYENGNQAKAKTTSDTTPLPPFVSVTPTRLFGYAQPL